MSVKEYLSQAKALDWEIDEKLIERTELRSLATRVTGTISDMPKASGGCLTERENLLAKLVDLENEIDAAVDKLVDLKRDIMALIEQLPDRRERAVLRMRYLHKGTWPTISERMHISEPHLYRLHADALDKLEKFYDASKDDSV